MNSREEKRCKREPSLRTCCQWLSPSVACCLSAAPRRPRPRPSLQPTTLPTLRDRSTRPVPVLYQGSLPLSRLLQGCLRPPQQPQVFADLQKQLSPPTLQPPPQNKHSHCQRATGARNEKQVSPRDLSAVAVRQLGVTTSGARERWGLTTNIQLPGPSAGYSSHLVACHRRL